MVLEAGQAVRIVGGIVQRTHRRKDGTGGRVNGVKSTGNTARSRRDIKHSWVGVGVGVGVGVLELECSCCWGWSKCCTNYRNIYSNPNSDCHRYTYSNPNSNSDAKSSCALYRVGERLVLGTVYTINPPRAVLTTVGLLAIPPNLRPDRPRVPPDHGPTLYAATSGQSPTNPAIGRFGHRLGHSDRPVRGSVLTVSCHRPNYRIMYGISGFRIKSFTPSNTSTGQAVDPAQLGLVLQTEEASRPM